MITLITGVPGSGKTLNCLRRVIEETDGQDRPIYYRGIRDLKLEWKEIQDDDCKKWFNYPTGSVFVIDECQQIWPNRGNNKAVPDSVARMDTHRHSGFDFYIITQKPTMVDFGVRGFVGRHFHYHRQFGHEACTEYEYQKAESDPQDYHTKQSAQTTRVKFPKKLYGIYHSAEVHTFKKRVPKAAVLVLASIVGSLAFGAYAFTRITGDRSTETTFTPEQYAPVASNTSFNNREYDPEYNYFEKQVPRLENVPYSAPMYDHLTTVKTYPRPQCMRNDDTHTCNCYTQQATPLNITYSVCTDIVDHGWFNPYRDESEERGGAGRQALANNSPQSVKPIEKPSGSSLSY